VNGSPSHVRKKGQAGVSRGTAPLQAHVLAGGALRMMWVVFHHGQRGEVGGLPEIQAGERINVWRGLGHGNSSGMVGAPLASRPKPRPAPDRRAGHPARRQTFRWPPPKSSLESPTIL